MDTIADILVERLFDEQEDATKFHYYIRAMFETVASKPVENCQELNRQMQLQGWENFEMDNHTFELVKLVLNDT